MKEKSKIITIVFSLIILVVISIFFLSQKEEKVLTNKKENKSNLISMMIEESNGVYKESNDTSWPKENEYIFNPNLSKCEKGSKLTWDNVNKKINLSTSTSDKCYVYFDKYSHEKYCKYSNEDSLVCDILRNKDETLYYHDENLTDGAEDYSYRFAGASEDVKNYVCFGSDEKTCPYDNLYRIIGLFKNKNGNYNIKVISSDYMTSDLSETDGAYVEKFPYVFDLYLGKNAHDKVGGYDYNNVTKSNNWEDSPLNSVNLNQNYLNNFSNDWQLKIEDYDWQIGGASYNSLVKNGAKVAYENEIGNLQKNKTTSTFKIGLMYVSDYYYGMLPEYWSYPGYPDVYYCVDISYCKKRQYNWLYLGLWEWLITPITDDTINVLGIGQQGDIPKTLVDGTSPVKHAAVRPCFYLKENVKVLSGTGTEENPYRLYKK